METIKFDNKLDIILLFLTAQYENRLTRSMKYLLQGSFKSA